MEKINDRRKFFKSPLLLLALCAGSTVYNLEQTNPILGVRSSDDFDIPPPPGDVSNLAPLGMTSIVLTADNVPTTPTSPFPSDFSNHNKVSMSVGKDNRLWIEVEGRWRRVALEG